MSELRTFLRDTKGVKRAQRVSNIKLEAAFSQLAYTNCCRIPLPLRRRAEALLLSIINKNNAKRLKAWQCARIGLV